MICCPQNITNFNNVSTTDVAFIGATPKVDVLYLVNGQWIAQGVSTSITLQPGNIHIDHGGPATGIVKLS